MFKNRRERWFFNQKKLYCGISLSTKQLIEPDDNNYERQALYPKFFKKSGFWGRKYVSTTSIFFNESTENWGYIRAIVLFDIDGNILSFNPLVSEKLVAKNTTVMFPKQDINIDFDW